MNASSSAAMAIVTAIRPKARSAAPRSQSSPREIDFAGLMTNRSAFSEDGEPYRGAFAKTTDRREWAHEAPRPAAPPRPPHRRRDPAAAALLGIAQDGGMPQTGCDCSHCSAPRRNPALARHVASLAIHIPGTDHV